MLLDTHVLVWLLQGSEQLGPMSRALIGSAARGEAGVLLAAISLWEVAMLVAKSRLQLDRDVSDWLRSALALPGLRVAPLDAELAVASSRLPGKMHGDPADRMIVATARQHGAVLVTQDRALLGYAAAGHLRAQRASD